MKDWVPPGPRSTVRLPLMSWPGRVYQPPSLSDAFMGPLPLLSKLLEDNQTQTSPPAQREKISPKVSINGDLIHYDYETNELGETVLAAHSVYASDDAREPVDSFDSSAPSTMSPLEEKSHPRKSTIKDKTYPSTSTAGVRSGTPERLPLTEKDRTKLGKDLIPSRSDREHNSNLSNDVHSEPRKEAAAALAADPLASLVQALSMLNYSGLQTTIKGVTSETLEERLRAGKKSERRLAAVGEAAVAEQREEESAKKKESIDELVTLGIPAAANFKGLFQISEKPELQSPVQYGLNVLNAKANVQIECRTPVVRTHTPLGAAVISLKNSSRVPSVIRNDLFAAYILGNEKNGRLPIVSVVEVSTFRNVARDYVVLVCGRPGRFVSYFLVGITFVFGDKKQATNICPVEFLCEEGSEVPPDEVALYFRTVPKMPLLPIPLPRLSDVKEPGGHVVGNAPAGISEDDYSDVPTPARDQFPRVFLQPLATQANGEERIKEAENFSTAEVGKEGLEDYWVSLLAKLHPILF